MEKDVRRLNILYEIIKEMISTNQWSITLKEKLEKMEELFSNIQSYDEAFIQSWTDKIVDLWKQYSMLSNYGIDEESIQPNNSLKENDIVWKILVSSKKITVMAASVGEINYLQHSIKNGNNEEIPKEQPLEPKLSKGDFLFFFKFILKLFNCFRNRHKSCFTRYQNRVGSNRF